MRQDDPMGSQGQALAEEHASEIVTGTESGGTNTSHTIAAGLLTTLLDALPPEAPLSAYEDAVVRENVLAKGTEGGRRRTFRYLRELYFLSHDSLLFRALRDLWVDPDARSLLAGLSALARDSVFRASMPVITEASPGELISPQMLAEAVATRFPLSYRESTLQKIGRNTASSWEQTGHLKSSSRSTKVRCHAACQPANVAYALLLGHIEGNRGEALFETIWAQMLDQSTPRIRELARAASQQGFINLRDAGGVVEIGFSALLRPFESDLL